MNYISEIFKLSKTKEEKNIENDIILQEYMHLIPLDFIGSLKYVALRELCNISIDAFPKNTINSKALKDYEQYMANLRTITDIDIALRIIQYRIGLMPDENIRKIIRHVDLDLHIEKCCTIGG